MTWSNMQRFGAAPPTCPEIRKMPILAYNFWTVYPKIIKLVSLDSGRHAESTDIQFYHVGHFGCRPFWIMCKNAVFYERMNRLLWNLVWVITTMPWSSLRSFETAPPSGEFFFSNAYNFGCGWHILMGVCFLVSWILADSNDTRLARFRHMVCAEL